MWALGFLWILQSAALGCLVMVWCSQRKIDAELRAWDAELKRQEKS